MNNDLISRTEAIDGIRSLQITLGGKQIFHQEAKKSVLQMLDDLPSAGINAIIKQSPTWIGVEERLPGCFENVLVCTEHEMLLCHYDGDEWVINYDGEYAGYDYKITHWMPLPKPPKKG